MRIQQAKVILIVIIMNVFSMSISAQWNLQHNFNPNTNDAILDIHFLNEDTGFVFGGTNWPTFNGYIYRTDDGGVNWNLLNIGITPIIRSGVFIDSLLGFAIGGGGLILKSIDGGLSWNTQIGGTSAELNSIFFNSPLQGHIGGQDIFLTTSNGGTTWNSIPVTGTIADMFFFNPDTGFVVGTNPVIGAPPQSSFIWKTINGGLSWTVKYFVGSSDIRSIQFINSNIGYAVGYDQKLKTTDGGETWNYMNLSPDAGTYDVFFTDADTGYVAGIDYAGSNQNPLIAKTTDGGNNWNYQSISTSVWLFSLYFLNSDIGYVSGFRGGVGPEVHKTINGGIFTNLNEFEYNLYLLKVYPNPSTDLINFDSPFRIDKLEITDITGSIIFQSEDIKHNYKIPINSFSPGLYIYKAYINNNVQQGKLVIQ